ncbi:unnamed protein product, partial [Amoebophrya sp. A120]
CPAGCCKYSRAKERAPRLFETRADQIQYNFEKQPPRVKLQLASHGLIFLVHVIVIHTSKTAQFHTLYASFHVASCIEVIVIVVRLRKHIA